MIKPTIGRIVDYWPDGFVEGEQPRAAQIAYVWSDTCINIGFLYVDGVHGNATSVPLWQGEDERPKGAHCSWMPYQIGQAKKHEGETTG
jgi:hypothetical protein